MNRAELEELPQHVAALRRIRSTKPEEVEDITPDELHKAARWLDYLALEVKEGARTLDRIAIQRELDSRKARPQ